VTDRIAVTAMAGPDDERSRRNLRLFWIHVLLAAGFLATFIWVTVRQ
jgi:hypothetical protein